ncbi:uncharacterized protein LOC115878604 [Sitophilus oryzae]|uniref:Uncharacterized protein LOC115878604 n=1 Tax=Sitophilus oryzae TaxID=7048 RepID=A0A6J2XIS8_SITOR|nr:uncharacterized protein LOC115878604 [Sitophilus oryzae]
METEEDFLSIGASVEGNDAVPSLSHTGLNLAPSGTSAESDFRTGWIYSLKKSELAAQLVRFGLDGTGTVEEMRRRIVRFIREGQVSPQPVTKPFGFPGNSAVVPTVSSTATLTTTTVTTTVTATSSGYIAGRVVPSPVVYTSTSQPVPLPINPGMSNSFNTNPIQVYKWGVTFNGRSDPVTFLERLEEICIAQNIHPDRLLPHLPEVLQGEAALWYRNNRVNYRTWEEFTGEFKIFYYPVNYEVDLEAKISRRVQRHNESVTAYITDLQTLIRRHGSISLNQELQWLYRNLLPEFRQYVRRGDFHDISSFSRITKEFELLNQELQRSSRTYAPSDVEARPNNTPRRDRLENEHAGARSNLMVIQSQSPSQSKQRHVSVTPRVSRYPYRAPNSAKQTSEAICWRCGQTGHFRRQCTSEPKIFCSRCKKTGVLSRNCPCVSPRKREPNRTEISQEQHYSPTEIVEELPQIIRQEIRPVVKIRYRNTDYLALLDTGAAHSYIGKKLTEQCQTSKAIPVKPTVKGARLANGATESISTAFRMKIQVGEQSLNEVFHSLKDLVSDMIIGMDILGKHDFQIDLRTRQIRLNAKLIRSSAEGLQVNPKKNVEQTTEKLRKGQRQASVSKGSRLPIKTSLQSPVEEFRRRQTNKFSDSKDVLLKNSDRVPVEKNVCWRCGIPGHLRGVCQRRFILFCSRCGTLGVRSQDCKCRCIPSRSNHSESWAEGGWSRGRSTGVQTSI